MLLPPVRSLPYLLKELLSLLLPGGRTAHKIFELPLQPVPGSCGYIKRGTQLADQLQQTSLIIWDEALMMHREYFAIVDRNLELLP